MRSLRSLSRGAGRRIKRKLARPVKPPSNLATPDQYWSDHTVHSTEKQLSTPEESLRYFQWRCEQYPGYLELMPVAGLDGCDVLDYGCGPGHDLVGFGTFSSPSSLVGLDVSNKALNIARHRLALHDFGVNVELRKIVGDVIPLPDSTIDYIHSSGVLHHLQNPAKILNQFGRILRPDGRVRIMVYNRDSIMWNLYVPYVLQIRTRVLDPSIPLPVAFRMSTDGFECPISITYTHESFSALAASEGFSTEYIGTSISQFELKAWSRYGKQAVNDSRLAEEHRDFLRDIQIDSRGQLSRNGKVPGLNLTLQLTRA